MILGIVLAFIIIIIGITKFLYSIKENNTNRHNDLNEDFLPNSESQDMSNKENKMYHEGKSEKKEKEKEDRDEEDMNSHNYHYHEEDEEDMNYDNYHYNEDDGEDEDFISNDNSTQDDSYNEDDDNYKEYEL